MRNAITRQIAGDFDVTTNYQEIAYPSDIGAALAHGGQVLLTFKRTAGTNITFKIEESVSDLAGYIAKVEDDGTDLTLIERTSTLATFSYVFNTLAEKVKVYVKGYTGNEVLDVFMTVGEINNIEQAQVPGSGSGTAGGDVQTAGADAESNTANAQTVASRMYGFNGSTWDRIKAGITTVTSTLTGWLNTLPWAVYHTTPSARTDGQGGPLEAGTSGQLLVDLYSALNALVGGVETDNIGVVPFRRADAFHAQFNGTCSTSVQVVKTATASKKHYITDLHISTDTAGWYSIVDGATTVLLGPYYMPANSVLPVKFATPVPGSTNTALNVDCSGSSGNVTVIIEGYTI